GSAQENRLPAAIAARASATKRSANTRASASGASMTISGFTRHASGCVCVRSPDLDSFFGRSPGCRLFVDRYRRRAQRRQFDDVLREDEVEHPINRDADLLLQPGKLS